MTEELSIWKRICGPIRQKIGEASFEAWLKPIKPKFDQETQTLILEVPNEFFKEWVSQHYDPLIKSFLAENKHNLRIDYRVNPLLAQEQIKSKRPSKNQAIPKEPRPAGGFFLNPKYTFENFIVGPSNRFTHAACLSIAESPAKAYNPLFIYGKVGLGKTHIMQAICHRIKQRNPNSKFYYTTSERFTNELIGAIQHRSTQAFREKFRNVDVLLIDDIHFIANKEATQEEFFHTFNALYDNHKQIIISSDRPPKEIAKLEARLVSRFGWGLVTDIQPPDLETRVAILKKKIENESIAIPEEVVFFIAEAIKSNIRELEGALVKVIAYSLLEEKPIALDAAKNILKDLMSEALKQISIEDIQQVVSQHFHISIEEFKSKKRGKHVVLPRQVAMFLARELTNLSLPEIGQYFGGKDHTTVLHSCKKIKKEIETDASLKNTIERLLLDIKR